MMVKIDRYLLGNNAWVKASETKVMSRKTIAKKIEENKGGHKPKR